MELQERGKQYVLVLHGRVAVELERWALLRQGRALMRLLGKSFEIEAGALQDTEHRG